MKVALGGIVTYKYIRSKHLEEVELFCTEVPVGTRTNGYTLIMRKGRNLEEN